MTPFREWLATQMMFRFLTDYTGVAMMRVKEGVWRQMRIPECGVRNEKAFRIPHSAFLSESHAIDDVRERILIISEFGLRRDPNEVVEHAVGSQHSNQPV